jgi:hypothetical protein
MTNCRIRNLKLPRAASILAAAAVIAASAHAQEPSHALMLAAYVNAAGGTDLTAGKYAAAIEQINRGRSRFVYRSAAIHTNLCVAYTAMRELAPAHAECDAALAAKQAEQRALPVWTFNAHRHPNEGLALAYSNRAVLCDVAADREGAARDLAAAAALAPEARFVRRNLDVINSKEPALASLRAP